MAENEKLEGLQMEELEALAGEFTLDDLAEFDEELEFDASELEEIKPEYTKKEKLRLLLMNNKVFSIIKWCFAGLGIVGLILYVLAMIDPGISEALTTTVSSAVRGGLTAVSNLLPVSLFEIVVLAVAVGLLAYAGFLVYKSIVEKEGIKIWGHWVQFAYVLLAVCGTGFLLFSMCYGVTTNRPRIYTNEGLEEYRPALPDEQVMDGSFIYYINEVNEAAVDGVKNESIFFTNTGNSRYASTKTSMDKISAAVNACFDLAAEDYPFLAGGEVKAKELIAKPLFTMMGIGSIYSPFTSEILINTDYPEVAVPMQVARAIAKQRGITNDADAKFISYLVCTEYADQLKDMGSQYNLDYIKYAASFDAYLEVGNLVFNVDQNMHLYFSAALKETAKREVLAYVKHIDTLYSNISNTSKLEFIAATDRTSTDNYLVLPKIMYYNFNADVESGKLGLQYVGNNPVPAKQEAFRYSLYLITYFAKEKQEDYVEAAKEVYEEYNPEPLPNDGTGGELV